MASEVSELTVEEPKLDPAEAIVSAACDALLDRFVTQSVPRLRKVSDALYDSLLTDVQEFLKSNANWNLASDIERCRCIEAQNRELLEKQNTLIGLLKQVVRPYGFADVALHHSAGEETIVEFLRLRERIDAAIA